MLIIVATIIGFKYRNKIFLALRLLFIISIVSFEITASNKFFNKNTVIMFKFDMDLSNPLQTNFNRTHCVLAGCPFCFN